ncbi:phosphatase 2C-like domain-containing protein [Mycena maculata]|uniref:Protein phosphatase n=1 Tax=Mycena maculata TaxID=230809 RepID=A0AAD7JYS7_9AGAR|nr:phosphatase 2C-like domain-containing protein [Mycena maculata]
MLWFRARRQLTLSTSARYSTLQQQLQRPYNFHIAAAWQGKPPWEDIPRPKVSFPPTSPIACWRDESVARLSDTQRSAGEDFFLYTNMRHNSGVALGVADGVGGWIDQGVDCSMFSQALMYYAHGHFKNGWTGEPEMDPTAEPYVGVEMTPSECLQLAYHDVLADESIEAGSSTACLITLNSSSGMLRSANLGDSGLCIVRSSSMVYYSSPQTHFFNCPRQLAKLQNTRGGSFNHEDSIRDFPSVADTYSTRLIDGDIVIAFTDGLADNVFTAETLKICSLAMMASKSEAIQVKLIAHNLVNYARKCMYSHSKLSPFQLEARRHRKRFQGGKIDDVTVLVALVRETL